MLEELRNSTRKIISERLVSPFLGTYSIAYACANWKVFILLFSGDIGTEKKIELISKYFSTEHRFISVLIFTVTFLLVYPWIATGAFFVWELAKKVKKEIFYKFENKTVLPIEKAVALREEYQKANVRFLDLFKDKKEIEEKFTSDLAASQSKVVALEKKVAEMEAELQLYKSSTNIGEVVSNEEESVLLEINKSGDDGRTKTGIANTTKIEYNRLLYVLQKLEEKQLIYLNRNEYRLTPTGRKLVYENLINNPRTDIVKVPGP